MPRQALPFDIGEPLEIESPSIGVIHLRSDSAELTVFSMQSLPLSVGLTDIRVGNNDNSCPWLVSDMRTIRATSLEFATLYGDVSVQPGESERLSEQLGLGQVNLTLGNLSSVQRAVSLSATPGEAPLAPQASGYILREELNP